MPHVNLILGFPGGSVIKNPQANTDLGLIPGLGRSPGEGNGKPLQYSCLVNPMDRGVWQVTVHRVAKSQTGLSLHRHTCTQTQIQTQTQTHRHTHTHTHNNNNNNKLRITQVHTVFKYSVNQYLQELLFNRKTCTLICAAEELCL